MDNSTLKKEVFDTLLELKKNEFSRLRKYQQEQLKSINKDDLDKHDMIESPMETQMREIRVENEVIDQLEKDIERLENIESIPITEEVQPWSLVKTNKQNFLVFLAQDKIEVGEEEFVGISAEAPIFEEMKGKKAGDAFSYKEEDYEIKEVV